MATMKRRVIYMSDEHWEAAKRQAEPFDVSVSDYIRSLILGGRLIPRVLRDQITEDDVRRKGLSVAITPPNERPSVTTEVIHPGDTGLSVGQSVRVITEPSFRSRPFTPAPKPGQKP